MIPFLGMACADRRVLLLVFMQRRCVVRDSAVVTIIVMSLLRVSHFGPIATYSAVRLQQWIWILDRSVQHRPILRGWQQRLWHVGDLRLRQSERGLQGLK